jgi:hypothetical protein
MFIFVAKLFDLRSWEVFYVEVLSECCGAGVPRTDFEKHALSIGGRQPE